MYTRVFFLLKRRVLIDYDFPELGRDANGLLRTETIYIFGAVSAKRIYRLDGALIISSGARN